MNRLDHLETAPPSLARHAGKCGVCSHPDREAIEEAFLHWRSPFRITIDYHLADRATIYRHAHATGLFARRRRNLRFVLEYLLENAERVAVTADSVIRAARAYARINDDGEWVDPPTHIIVSSGPAARHEPAEGARPEPNLPSALRPSPRTRPARRLNRNTEGFRHEPTR